MGRARTRNADGHVLVLERRERLGGAPLHVLPTQKADARRLDSEKEILGDAQVRCERELLVDHDDPALASVSRAPRRVGPTVDGDVPRVRRQHSGEKVHESTLPRSVLSDEGPNLPRPHGEGDIVDGDGRPEALRQLLAPRDAAGRPRSPKPSIDVGREQRC